MVTASRIQNLVQILEKNIYFVTIFLNCVYSFLLLWLSASRAPPQRGHLLGAYPKMRFDDNINKKANINKQMMNDIKIMYMHGMFFRKVICFLSS